LCCFSASRARPTDICGTREVASRGAYQEGAAPLARPSGMRPTASYREVPIGGRRPGPPQQRRAGGSQAGLLPVHHRALRPSFTGMPGNSAAARACAVVISSNPPSTTRRFPDGFKFLTRYHEFIMLFGKWAPPKLDFPQFRLRGTESPRIVLASEREFPPFWSPAGTWKNPVGSKAHAGQRRSRR
jgi:hypothetical protein